MFRGCVIFFIYKNILYAYSPFCFEFLHQKFASLLFTGTALLIPYLDMFMYYRGCALFHSSARSIEDSRIISSLL